MKKFTPLLLIAVLFGIIMQPAQTFGQAAKHKFLNYIFPSDSIRGFDETQANLAALHGGFFGPEYKVYMYRAKRNFINAKYNINQANGWSTYGRGVVSTLAAPCVNEDFESSPIGLVGPTLTGWTISEGSNTGSCAMAGCCPTSGGNDAWIRTTPWVGPAPMTSIPNSPLGGTKVLQMNDNITNMGEVVRIQQTFNVTPTNALFQLAYMAAMDGSAHLCCDQPYMKITMLDCSNNPLACPSISITPPGSACASSSPSGWTVNTSGISYTSAWQVSSIDLTPYLGTCVTIQITVGDCDGWAHPGWAFVDCLCSPMTVTVNNVPFPIGTAATTVAACGAATGTVTAPPGLGPYNWNGPVGSGITNNPNQTFTTSTTGNYTLTMNPLGSCAPITRTVNLIFAPNPVATFNVSNACTTYSFTNTGTGPPAVQTYSFVGAGPPPSFTTTATTTVVSFPPSTTFTVMHTVTNSSGCVTTNSLVINVPAGPNPAFTASPSYTQCLLGNSFTFNAAAAGTHTFAFNPAVSAPPTGFTSPYGPVSFAAAGTYTVTHTITSGGCTTSASSVIVINPQPTVTANNNGPLCTGSTLTLTGTGGGTYSWTGPAAFSSALQNPTIAGITPANAGVYTLVVTLNGCTSTATTNVVISTPTAAANNTGPYCIGQTISLTTPAATSYTWSGPAAFASNLQNPTRPAATLAMAGTYTVTTTTGVCTSSAVTTVVVNPAPTPIANSNSPVCAGTPINFTGSGASTYTWTGPAAFNSTNQNPVIASAAAANAGTYTLTVTAANGCTATVTTPVIVNPLPVPVVNNNGPVCVGTNLVLTATGGGTYSWTGPNAFSSAVQNPTITPAALVNAGTYTVLVTLNTCTAVGTTNAIVSTATASASNTGPYCAGTTIQLNTAPATTYTWSGPGGYSSNAQNPTRPLSTPAMSGTYTVIVSIGTCTASATTSVTVNALPAPVAANNSPVCAGNTVSFTGLGGVSYFWGGPGSYTSAVQNPVINNASAATAGSYTLLVVDANTCTNIAVTNVVVNPNPTITVNNPTVCLNQTINLTSTGGSTYSWSGPNAYVSAAQNPNIPNAALNMSGAYTVTVTTAAGCTNTAVSNVAVFPLPNPAIISNTPCVGSTLNLSGSGGATYVWSGPGGFSSNSQNPSINNVTLPANGTYTLLAASGTCTASTTANITVNPLPNPVINSNSPVCVGRPIHFNGTGGVSYMWTGPMGFNDITQTPTIVPAMPGNAGIYTLTVTDANNCVNTTTSAVVVNVQPVVSASGGTVCENSNASLGATGGITYAWTGPNGFTSNVQNPLLAGVTPMTAGQYTVIVTDVNTCTNTAYAVIGINPAPTPSIVTNSPICINSILNLSASGGLSYAWTGPNGFVSSAQSNTILASSLAVGGIYSVTVVDSKSCTATTGVTTTINPPPAGNIVSTPNKGCAPLCVTYTCQTVPVNATCNWMLGDGSSANNTPVATACYNQPGTYTITTAITDLNGCQNSTTYTAQVYPQPVADFNYAPYHPIVNVDDVNFTDASYGAPIAGWSWYFMNTAQYTSTLQNPIFSYQDAGEYAVALVVKSDKGCMDTVVKSLVVGEDFGIWVPNAFTPNGDGLNDEFYAKGFGVTKFEMTIFDRWGEKIFHADDIRDAWDGTYQGRGDKKCTEDAYTWLIKVVSVYGKAKELTGHVTLIK